MRRRPAHRAAHRSRPWITPVPPRHTPTAARLSPAPRDSFRRGCLPPGPGGRRNLVLRTGGARPAGTSGPGPLGGPWAFPRRTLTAPFGPEPESRSGSAQTPRSGANPHADRYVDKPSRHARHHRRDRTTEPRRRSRHRGAVHPACGPGRRSRAGRRTR
ncbi:hypothetical protein SGPA1_21214 [Streptomyces misionensis JCM 4497]